MQATDKERGAPGLKGATVRKQSPGPDEGLTAGRRTGVCGTDVHIADWGAWAEGRIKPPLVVGHEFAGEIVAAGDGVGRRPPGPPVTAKGDSVWGAFPPCPPGHSPNRKNPPPHRVELH